MISLEELYHSSYKNSSQILLPWQLFLLILALSPGAAAAADFGTVLTTGIQDISAVAAVFGTDLVEKQCNRTLKGLQYPVFATMGMFGSLGYVKWALQTLLPLQVSLRLFTPENGQMSFDCNIWMFIFDVRKRWTDASGPIAPPKAWNFCTGAAADAYNRLQLRMDKETVDQPIISACFASILAIASSFTGLIAFVPQFSELGIQWGPIVRCSASAVLAICNLWQPLLFTIFLIPSRPGVMVTDAKGKVVALMMASVLLFASCALLAGYIGSYQMVQAGSSNASVQWLAVELCLMVIRLSLWSVSPSFLRYTSLRIKPEGVITFATQAHKRWLNADETKLALIAFGASVESINDFGLAGFRLQMPKIYVAAVNSDGKEEKYLVSQTRPQGETEGLWGKLLAEGNVPIGDAELIGTPIRSSGTVDGRPTVDELLHNRLVDSEGYPYPSSHHYQLDLIPRVSYWRDDLRVWWTPPSPLESESRYHPLTELKVMSWIEDAFSYWIDKYRKHKYKEGEESDDTKSVSTENI